MKRSSIFSVIVLSLALCVSAASYCVDRVTTAVYATGRWLRDFTFGVVSVVAGPAEPTHGPAVRLVQAKHYLGRLIRRERPQVTNTWRMCPST